MEPANIDGLFADDADDRVGDYREEGDNRQYPEPGARRVTVAREPVASTEEVECPPWIVDALRRIYGPTCNVECYGVVAEEIHNAWQAAGSPKP